MSWCASIAVTLLRRNFHVYIQGSVLASVSQTIKSIRFGGITLEVAKKVIAKARIDNHLCRRPPISDIHIQIFGSWRVVWRGSFKNRQSSKIKIILAGHLCFYEYYIDLF
jgi:hypothetical protein